MRVVVAQAGARHQYAVPAALNEAGLLERFYTDMCADVGLGRILTRTGFPIAKARLLAGRILPEKVAAKTVTFSRPNIAHFVRSFRSKPTAERQYIELLRWQRELGSCMAQAGFGRADWLYASLDEFPTLLIEAKERGLKVISEVYTQLSNYRIVTEEVRRFPGLEPAPLDIVRLNREACGEHVIQTHCDFALCPSQSVQEDLVQNWGFKKSATYVVPYGVGKQWFRVINKPVVGRVLFAGSANLNKGIHYLAMAAEKLHKTHRSIEVRVAGNVTDPIAGHSLFRHLTFLGRIPRQEIYREFATADIFVLPSLAEGSASATYEALASGVPVVATQAAGSVMRDGLEGRIVPERDATALALAMSEIIENRHQRERMACAARQRAQEFTWERYRERLVASLVAFSGKSALS